MRVLSKMPRISKVCNLKASHPNTRLMVGTVKGDMVATIVILLATSDNRKRATADFHQGYTTLGGRCLHRSPMFT